MSTTASVLGKRVQTRRFRWARALLGIVPLAAALAYAGLHYDAFDWGEFRHTFALIDQAYPGTSDFGMLDVAAFWGFVAIRAVIQLPGVGGGMQIASVLALAELFKLPAEPATGLALLIWAGSSLVALPLGVPCLFHEGLSWRAIRQLREESGL